MTGNRKKGVSIGAAMKQRMESGEPAQEENKVADIQTAPEAADPLESFNTRLPRSLQKQLKVHAAVHGTKIQDVLQQALSEYLERHKD